MEVTDRTIHIASESFLLIFLFSLKSVEVTIPEIEVMRLAHYSTIASECSTSLSSYLEKLYVNFSHHTYISVINLCCIYTESTQAIETGIPHN